MQQSIAIAAYGCQSLGQDPQVAARWKKYSTGTQDQCDRYEGEKAREHECIEFRDSMAQHAAEMEASRARFQQELTQQIVAGIGDIAGTARQIDAANHGKVIPHQRVKLPVPDLSKLPAGAVAACLSLYPGMELPRTDAPAASP